jgi:hypothetical protein
VLPWAATCNRGLGAQNAHGHDLPGLDCLKRLRRGGLAGVTRRAGGVTGRRPWLVQVVSNRRQSFMSVGPGRASRRTSVPISVLFPVVSQASPIVWSARISWLKVFRLEATITVDTRGPRSGRGEGCFRSVQAPRDLSQRPLTRADSMMVGALPRPTGRNALEGFWPPLQRLIPERAASLCRLRPHDTLENRGSVRIRRGRSRNSRGENALELPGKAVRSRWGFEPV